MLRTLIHSLLHEAQALGWVQWAAFMTGLVYIYFATRNDSRCWIWGIVSSGLWAYASWFQLNLLSDAVLQLIYVGLGGWGLYAWRIKKNASSFQVTHVSRGHLILSLVIGSLLSIGFGHWMSFTQAAFPTLDATLTVFSILATIMLIRQQIENWIFWIIINLVSIPVFVIRGGHLFAILFMIYFVLSIKGWRAWHQWLDDSTPGKPLHPDPPI